MLYYMQIGYYALDMREPIEARVNLTPHYLKAFTGVPRERSGSRCISRLRRPCTRIFRISVLHEGEP